MQKDLGDEKTNVTSMDICIFIQYLDRLYIISLLSTKVINHLDLL